MDNLNLSQILPIRLFALALLLATAARALAGVHYVDVNGTNATPPYINWTTAATNIQAAVDVAVAGDEIVVTNGTYATGGRVDYGTMNRVFVDKQLSVRSVNGPQSTIIDGGGAARCALLYYGASLRGFTLTHGIAYGGGAQGGTLNNCVLIGNSSVFGGGGATSCTLNNCVLSGNSAPNGGGASGCYLNNCTLTGNSASDSGGGVYGCTLNNCISYFNTAPQGANYDSSSFFSYSCTTPLPATGAGNLSADPQLASASHLSAASPCRGAGNPTNASGTDIDGEAWLSPPSMGCDEYHGGTVTGPLNAAVTASFTNVGVGFSVQLTAFIAGRTTASVWDFGDSIGATNQPYTTHAWTAPGDYAVVLHAYNASSPGGISATVTVHVVTQPVHYVAAGNASPVAPYTSWATAATNIQDAVDAATVPGTLVLVTNGVYAAGGRAIYGTLTNRVAVDKLITLRSANGPQVTVIKGFQVPGTTNGDGAIRCVYLTTGASLYGFTLTNGATRALYENPPYRESGGGGLWCEATNSVLVSNCVVAGNSAYYGGGVYSGTLYNCTLSTNSASSSGGGAYQARLGNCTLTGNSAPGYYGGGGGACYGELDHCTLIGNSGNVGGGVNSGTLNHCTLIGNSASSSGGGVYYGTLTNCTLAGNSTPYSGGGAYYSTLDNCTLSGNSASQGGGAFGARLNNCTLSGNSAGFGAGVYYGSTLNNCVLTGNHGSGADGCSLTNCVLSGNSDSGAYRSTLRNCALTGNSGAGAFSSTLNNCTLTGNSYGGAYNSTLSNCIVYFNTGLRWANYDSGCTLNYCCTTPQPAKGIGNISSDPLLASASHLSAGSPCRGAGNAAYANGTDLDGETWANPPSIGCDEYHAGAVTGPLGVAITVFTNVAVGFAVQLAALIDGRTTASSWDFGDGITATNQPHTSHAWSAAGDYAVVLRAYNESHPGGISATVNVHVVTLPIHYVAAGSANPVAPYTSWASAARNIQDAVDAATVPGALVLVTNGIYATGSRLQGGASNRVVIAKPLTVRSVNGPQFAAVDGGHSNRCVYLADGGANLSGFTVSNGAAGLGAGVSCESARAVVSNCVVVGNSASDSGGGVYGCTLNNCTLSTNSASQLGGGANYSTLNNCTLSGNSATNYGGGAYDSALSNCTISGNSAGYGGGAYASTLNNCALTGNSAPGYGGGGGGASGCTLNNCALTGNSASDSGGGAYSTTLNNCTLTGNSAGSGGGAGGTSTLNNCIVYFNVGGNYTPNNVLNYCCTTPQANGVGNISVDPLLASASHLSAVSPCRGAGNPAYATGPDIDGEAWLTPPSIGCDEYHAGAVTGPLRVGVVAAFTNVAVGFQVEFRASIEGRTATSVWDFGDGITTTNQPYMNHSWTTPGDYMVVLRAYNESFPGGISATITMHVVTQPVHYVAADSTNPAAPYISWATAATNIQEAVDAATMTGALVLVSNGVYAAGGRAVDGTLNNRVAVDKPLNVRSVNGPQSTTIYGGGVRCVYLTNSATLSGFTMANGYAPTGAGAGVFCESQTALVSNCFITGNSAYNGGGAYRGTLNNCLLSSNSASSYGGAAYGSTLHNCTLTTNSAYIGGGAASSTLNHCTLTNSAGYFGGGAYSSILNDCVLSGNIGGGANGSMLSNCTLTNNAGSGADGCTLNNCTLNRNSGFGATWGALNHCALSGNSSGGANNATLDNCTLSGNFGQGAVNCTLSHCALTNNSSTGAGSSTLINCILTANFYGAYSCTLINCAVTGNSSGVSDCALTNCTVTGNSGVGAQGGTLNNCLVYFNLGGNYISSSNVNYCCTTPLPTNGVGNISSEPQLVSPWRLSVGSPCRGAGNAAYATGADIDGEPWDNPPSIGCDEYYAGAQTGPLSVVITASLTNVLVGYAVQLTGLIEGRAAASSWDFGDGATATNQPYTSHAWTALGDYTVLLRAYNETYPGGISATVTVHVVTGVHYVAAGSTNPVSPYTSWATAASSLQEAINAAEPGATQVVVSNGVYAPIYLPALMTVRSINGPQFTIISGGGYSRCASLATNAILSGFSLINGHASDYGGGAYGGTLTNCTLTGNVAEAPLNSGYFCVRYQFGFCQQYSTVYFAGNAYGGGAAYCTLNNCTLTGNTAEAPLYYNYGYNYYAEYSVGNARGGGAAFCTLNNCTLTGNLAQTVVRDAYYGPLDNNGEYGREAGGGGVYGCTLTNCALSNNRAQGYIGYIDDPYDPFGYGYYIDVPGLGGGTLDSTLNNCTLTGNSASDAGSGAYGSTLANCALTGNSGEGAVDCALTNCTLTGNSAVGASSSSLDNCIVYFNAAANYDSYCALNYCCTTPLPTNGVGNISSDPQLASASHLSFLSPCIGRGNHGAASGVDIDGEPWANPPSMGCDELHAGTATGPLSVGITASLTNVAVGYPVALTGLIGGRADLSLWSFGDGAVEINQPYVTHSWSAPGNYAVTLWAFNESYPDGISATQTIHVVTGVHYVAANSASPAPPYTSWGTAATNIQDAISTVEPGGSVVVSNGSYAPIHASGALSVRSVNGAVFTIINGARSNPCASLTSGITLSGFTLTNGAGGASGGTLNNCIIVGNSGSGASGSTLNNCALTGNYYGASSCTLNNCTLTGNSGSGAYNCSLTNCIVYFNTAPVDPNYSYSTLNYCCTTPQPTTGVGNISADPQLANAWRLSASSPCCGAGNPGYAIGTDIDGEAWASSPSMGCDEYQAGALTGPLDVDLTATFTNVTKGFVVQFTGLVAGRAASNSWDFGDGITATNEPYISHAWVTPGDYAVVLRAYNESQPGGISATQIVHVVTGVHYVALGSLNPVAPYTSWATAATNIQDAVDAAIEPGAQVLVTNGIYATGGRAVSGATNRVVVHTFLTVRSVNGPQFTIIDGGQSVRCVYLTNDATLSGFSLTHGLVAGTVPSPYGAGVSCASQAAVVSNCVVAGNSASYGGGVYGGTLNNCLLSGNSAVYDGGAASDCTLNNCTLSGNSAHDGGGAAFCTLNNCAFSGNFTTLSGFGGGAYGGTLNNCLLNGNSAYDGGGAMYSTLNNCILTGNSAPYGGGANSCTMNNCTVSGNLGLGASGCMLNSCIVYFNTAGDHAYSTLNYCCTTPQPTNGMGNITDAPLFVEQASGNLRLQSNSPCINAGNNAYVSGSTDMDGLPRIVGGRVDIGAYESQSYVGGGFVGWLQQYGLATDGSADYADPDGDGMNNWREWVAGTVPTDGTSALRLLTPVFTRPGVLLRWSSDTNHAYFVERTTTLKPPLTFSRLRNTVPGLSGTTTFTDPAPPATGAAFYRVGTASTNAPSPLWLQPPIFVPGSVVVSWTSVTNRSYFLERATNLTTPMTFTPLATNLVGHPGTTTYTDTNTLGAGPCFYRVGVSAQ